MNRRLLIIPALAGVFACSEPANRNPEEVLTLLNNAEMIKRGELLVTTSVCNDCHSPKIMTHEGMIPDTTRLLSGHPQDEAIPDIPDNRDGWVLFTMGLTAAVGPWGVSYAANLTPDDTGIGNWTLEQFKTAIRKGKSKGLEDSRSLLPPMPWDQFKSLSDQDLEAIFTYLQSIKPVKNLVPSPTGPDKLKELR